MEPAIAMSDLDHEAEPELRHALAQGDAMLSSIGPILGHLLTAPDHSLFSDEIVARVRGMLTDLARQILWRQAEAAGDKRSEAFLDRHGEPLSKHLQKISNLLSHCHALAIEWQLSERLEKQSGLDPVLSPLMQRQIADPDPTAANAAMALLAAQARFTQSQRRMELPLAQLPGELFHETLIAWRSYCGHPSSEAVERAELSLRHDYDESAARQVLLQRLIASPDNEAGSGALDIADAGAAIFFTALAHFSGQPRDLAVLSSHRNQIVRLGLGLRAAGLEATYIDEILIRLHPGAAPIGGLEDLDREDARAILRDAAHRLERG